MDVSKVRMGGLARNERLDGAPGEVLIPLVVPSDNNTSPLVGSMLSLVRDTTLPSSGNCAPQPNSRQIDDSGQQHQQF